MPDKKDILGQFFTQPAVVKRLLDLLFSYHSYSKSIKILEPAAGTNNFVNQLKRRGFRHLDACEIDPDLTSDPQDFFHLPLTQKYDLIVTNPPFSKYNLPSSYFFPKTYLHSSVSPAGYLSASQLKKPKLRIETVFLFKALKHLQDQSSSLAFILPISFFIKNKHRLVKDQLAKHFSTIIIYQDDQTWFDYHIPCCFVIFTNLKQFKNQIVLLYQSRSKSHQHLLPLSHLHHELIPRTIFYQQRHLQRQSGLPLKRFLKSASVPVKKSFTANNVSAANILQKTQIPPRRPVEDFKLAVVRVGNSSVGRSGLINPQKDILNDMFYVFAFRNKFNKNKQLKQAVCQQLNQNLQYFRDITCRVGSKSLKKRDILDFKVDIKS